MSVTPAELVASGLVESGLVIRPGDTLVLGVSDAISMAEMDEIRASCEKWLPGVKVVVFEATSLAVYRPDET